MTEKNIRLMKKSDYDAIRVLHQCIYKDKNPDEDWSVEDFETYFEEGMSFVYCDDADKSKIQGFIFATTKTVYPRHHYPYDIFIGNIAAAQGERGVGSELLKVAIEGTAKKLKKEELNIGLCVEATNQTAIKFYEKNSFIKKQVGHTVFYMVKKASLKLSSSQTCNPGNCTEDPSISMRTHSLKLEEVDQHVDLNSSSFSPEHVIEINALIAKLKKEIQSSWPYPHKDRKAQKIQGLNALLFKSTLMDARTAVTAVEAEFLEIRKGNISTRTADLLDSLRNYKNNLQI